MLVTGSWRSWPPPLGKGGRMKTADAVEAELRGVPPR